MNRNTGDESVKKNLNIPQKSACCIRANSSTFFTAKISMLKVKCFFSNLIDFLFEEYMESVFELLPISDERVCFGQH